MQNFHKIIIIGAGPVGLYFASKCEKAGLDYLILEGSNIPGGQLSHLYPEKEVVDIPGIDSILAKDYIALLLTKISDKKITYNASVVDIKNGDFVEVFTEKVHYFCEKLIIATGLGSSKPRPLGIEGEDGCMNIRYSLRNYEFLKDKNVAIFGGGDSALDWAKMLSKISNGIHLIHRRDEFRGNPETIKDCNNLHVHKPYVPYALNIEGVYAKSVVIKKVSETEETFEEIPVDYVFVNFGNVASQSKFPFKMVGAFLLVDDNLQLEKNIYAIGDVAQYENKKRRMAPGNLEADKVFKLIN